MFAFEIDHLTTDHTGTARARRKRHDQVTADLRIRMGVIPGQDFEGQR